MKKKLEIRNRALMIAAIVIAAVVITVLNVRMVFDVTTRQTEELGSLQMESIRAQLQQTLNEARQDTLQVSMDVDLMLQGRRDDKALEAYLREAKRSSATDSCINVYVASPYWYIIPDFEVPEDFDQTSRNWYQGAVEMGGDIFISQPYMDLASDFVCFTVSKLLSDGRTVVALDYNLSEVQDYIKSMSEGGRTAFIVTESGEIAGYTDETKLGQQLSQVSPEYVDILELEKSNANQVVLTKDIDGVEQTIFCSKTQNNWYLILCVSSAKLYSKSYKQLGWLTFVNGVLIFGIILLYVITLRNRRKAEKALQSKEDFLTNMSKELMFPIDSILNTTNPELNISKAEGMEQIREQALRLSDMVENLISYSDIVSMSDKEKGNVQYRVNQGLNKHIRATIISVILVAMGIGVYLFSSANIRLGAQQIKEESSLYEYELKQWISEQKSILGMFVNMVSANPEMLEDYEYAVKYLDDITQNYDDISVVYMTNPMAEHTVIMNNGWQPEEGWYVEERQWYKDTIASKDGFNISSPYFDEQTGLYCVTFSQCVYDKEGNFLGNFGIDFYMDKLIDILGQSYTDTGYAFLVDADGNIINHPYAYYQMTQSQSSSVFDKDYMEAYVNGGAISSFKDYDNIKKVCIADKDEDSRFTVIVVKNWWSIFGKIVLYCGLFIMMFGGCVFAVYYLISRLMKWQAGVNVQLQEAVETATAAGKAKSQFLAQMSHEIRTPINAVLGMNEMIIRETEDKTIKEYAADIQSAGRTLLSLINSILDFSKIEDGKMEIIDVEYGTASMINDLVNMISERAAKKGLELKLEIDENLPVTLFGDDLRIRQVITNLLTNAVKYTEIGSVTLKVTGTKLNEKKLKLSVAVSDTGKGIREEDRFLLCQSFQRLEEEKNRNIEGTGLGLSIVSRLLQMMGSELKMDSVYGEGSCFYFEVRQGIVCDDPIGDYEKRRADSIHSKEENTYLYAPDANILVVDDNDVNLKVVRNLMKRNGIIPDTAASGVQCISAVENKGAYDIIFLDHMMPGMDGIETLQQLRSRKLISQDSIVIALTANAIVGAKEQYLAAGFTDYLSKPIDVAQMEKKLKQYLPADKYTFKTAEAAPEPEVKIVEKPAESELIPVEEEVAEATVEESALETEPVKDQVKDQVPEKKEEKTESLIDYDLGLSYCLGMVEAFREIVKTYIDIADEKTADMKSYYEAKDWKNYEVIVHGLKSSSLMVGAKTLSELAKEHEFAAKENRIADIDKSYEELLALYQKVLAELTDYLAK